MITNSKETRPLPYSLACERALICSLLRAPGAVAKLCGNRVPLEAFSTPAYRAIFELVIEWSKPDQQVDLVWLCEKLGPKQLEECGGKESVNELYDVVPTAANADHYIWIVLKKYERRRLIVPCNKFTEQCYDQEVDIAPLLAEVQKEILAITREDRSRPSVIEFLSPSELQSYQPPPGIVLVGDNHVTRGSVFVIGGAPGVGKSRASVALAEAGATGCEWFGFPVHSKFRTLIVQNENGRFRLKQEFSELSCETLDQYVRVTPPPPYGLCFDRSDFRDRLSAVIDDFAPGVIIIDPWNAASRDEKARSMLETFESIRSIIPAGDDGPAIGIVAHTRKPQTGERSSGRALLNLLAGSYVLGSVPRSVFIMQAASDDVTDNRVVWTCCKNNDGELGKRSVWERRNGLFTPVSDFDWDAFDFQAKDDRVDYRVVGEIVEELNGGATKAQIVAELEARGASSASAYRYIQKAAATKLIKLDAKRNVYAPA